MILLKNSLAYIVARNLDVPDQEDSRLNAINAVTGLTSLFRIRRGTIYLRLLCVISIVIIVFA